LSVVRRSLVGSQAGRALLFGFLYFVQGAILAYVYVFNSLYLRSSGASAQQLSLLTGLLVLPFVFKIGIGLLSDRYNVLGYGHRRPFIVFGMLLMSAGSAAVTFLHPVEQYPLFVFVAFFIASGLAFFDTTVDGYAVDVTPAGEQGTIQGVMTVGRSLGTVSMAFAYGVLIDLMGWDVVFWCMAAFSLLPFLILWRAAEPAERPPSRSFDWSALLALRQPASRHIIYYAFFHAFVLYGANTLIPLYLNEELGQSFSQVGSAAMLGSVGMVIGGIGATLIVRRRSVWYLGRLVSVAALGVLLVLGIPGIQQYTVAMLIIWGICFAGGDLIFVTVSMMRADPRLGAGTYAVYMAVSNLFVGLAAATVQRLIDTVPYQWQFWALALLSLLLYPFLMRIARDNDNRRASPPAATGERQAPPPV
jgi:PAT family beta-lactamase induction signal transducer AmpG